MVCYDKLDNWICPLLRVTRIIILCVIPIRCRAHIAEVWHKTRSGSEPSTRLSRLILFVGKAISVISRISQGNEFNWKTVQSVV